jgi:hypothetical protein
MSGIRTHDLSVGTSIIHYCYNIIKDNELGGDFSTHWEIRNAYRVLAEKPKGGGGRKSWVYTERE